MDTSKYLPIGSVIKIEQFAKEVMIIVYMAYTEDNKAEIISRDYVGIPVEEGYKEDNRILFNKEDITNVIFIGYKTYNTVNILNNLDKSLDFFKRIKPDDDIIYKKEQQ